MAISAAAIAKAAAMALSNEKVRKGVGWTIAAILSPLVLVLVAILALFSGATDHNSTALDTVFYNRPIGNVPYEYKVQIEEMQRSFGSLDGEIARVNSNTESESLDDIRVKAVFYALFFGQDDVASISTDVFVECFYVAEERTRTVTSTDEDGNETSHTETYTVYIPISDMGVVYGNIASSMGKQAVTEDIANATEIYYRIKYGRSAPTYGAEFDDFIGSLPTLDIPFVGVDGFVEPISGWENAVTSEYGERVHPVTNKKSFHTGIDLGKPRGTPVYSVLDGTVILVRYSNTGYGYHVMVDHGGGFVTLYAHNSKLLVHEGQTVTAGEKIAEVGTTGMSTGNHLHFEIKIGGGTQNPRSYLP